MREGRNKKYTQKTKNELSKGEKTMKKFFAILLTLALVVSLAACGGGNEPASPSPAPSPSAGGDTPAPADPEDRKNVV